MSEILKKIGRIRQPFSHDVMAGYAAAVVEEVGEAKGPLAQASLLERIVQDHLPHGISPEMLKKHIFTPHAWIHVALYMAFNQVGALYLNDQSLFRRLGARVLHPTKLQMQAARFFSLKSIYSMVGLLNANFNNALHMGVWNRRWFKPEIVLYRKSQISYRRKISEIVEDQNLFKEWLAIDCQITKGVLENVSSLLGKEKASIAEEPECEGKGDHRCLYVIQWKDNVLASLLITLWKKLITLDHHWELKHQVKIMEATIKDRLSRLEATQKELEIANQRLSETSYSLIQTEKRELEHCIMGGFAHEMRNSLTGTQLDLTRLKNYSQSGKSVGSHINHHLEGLFAGIDDLAQEYGLPTTKIGEGVVPHVEAINRAAEEVDRIVNAIEGDLQRALAITSQIASYAQLGKERPGNEPVDLVDIIASIASRHIEEIKAASIRLELHLPEKLIISGSKVHFYSIFDNLVRNAIKAINKVKEKKDPAIEVFYFPGATVHIFKIRDSGCGISAERQANIFDPFVTDGEGMGLGLAVVKRLADLYKWKIELESSPGGGTVFSIIIPKNPP